MGSKKREATFTQESSGVDLGAHISSEEHSDKEKKRVKKKKHIEMHHDENQNDQISSEEHPDKKKVEKKKKNIERYKNGNQDDTSTVPDSSINKLSLNSMERKKRRKLLDKERNEVNVKNDNLECGKLDNVVENSGVENGSATRNGITILPEFHIGVFKDLAVFDASARESAAKALVTELWKVQDMYEKLEDKALVEDKSKLEAEKDDGLKNCAPSVRYAVRRLIRGVSSSREFARQGFSLGLTVLVSEVSSIKLESLLKLIISLLEISSSMKGQDAKDCLLGRLFAYGAIARSGRLTKEWKSDQNTPLIREFTSSLISIATKKRYLQEPAVLILLEMIEKLPVEALMDHVIEAPVVQDWFVKATEAGNPDALLLALKLKGKESTFCLPRVHPIWPFLVSYLLPDCGQDLNSEAGLVDIKKHKRHRKCSSVEEETERNFKCFFGQIIEESLFSSSHDRKKLAFDVCLLLLPRIPTSCVRFLLSYKVVQCIIDVLSTKDSWLHKVAQNFLKELSQWVKQDEFRRAEVIVALQKQSNGKFDCLTRSKTVKDLLMDFKTESGCTLYIQTLVAIFLGENNASEEPSDQSQTADENSETGSIEDKDAVWASGGSEFLRSWIVESFLSILKNLKVDQDAKFRVQKDIMKFLAVQGLSSSALGFEVTSFDLKEKLRWPNSPISNSLSLLCIEQLQLLLANAQKGEVQQTVGSCIEANDLGSEFMHFLSTLCNIPSVSLSRPLSDDDEKSFKMIQAMVSQLSKEERKCGLSTDANKFHALRYLLIQLLLQIFLRPGEFFEAGMELAMCCKKAIGLPDVLESAEEDEPELMDVLVDTMLSLLPHTSSPLRSAIELVFKYYCDDIMDDGLHRMLCVIKKELKPARHKNTNDEDEDEDGEELLGVEEAEESYESETGETADSDDHRDDSEVDDSEAVKAVDTVPAELLDASDDDSDEGMDDDAMFRMDTYLAKIFKEKKNQAGTETAHSQLVLFKLRVLSLLEIYLHENPGRPQVVKIFSNLAHAFANPQKTEGSEQLSQRMWGIIQKKIFKAKDYPKCESVQLSALEPLLEKYLKLAAKPFKRKKSAPNPSNKKESASWKRYRMINSLAQSSTFWILKLIDAGNFKEPELQGVNDIFQTVLEAYFDSKKSQMKVQFLKEIFRRRPWIGHNLLRFLLEKCSSAKSQFRQVEALELVMEVLKSITSSKSDQSTMDSHLPNLSHLISHLVKHIPEKQSRRVEVLKFCRKVLQMLNTLNLGSRFMDTMGADDQAACATHLGETFLTLKK